MQGLFTLHECLQDAALMSLLKLSKLDYVKRETFSELMRLSSQDYQEVNSRGLFAGRLSFCCSPQIVSLVGDICRANGATVSSFLRACCERLVEEYNYANKEPK